MDPSGSPATVSDSAGWVSGELEVGATGLPYNRRSRLTALLLLFLFALMGNAVVIRNIYCSWLRRRRKSRRIDQLFLNLAVADLCVALLTLLSQLVWEGLDNVWLAGDAGCKLVKVAQIFGLAASSNMIVAVALERQRIITKPLASPMSIKKLSASAWVCALVLSIPQAFVFRETMVHSTTRCLNVFHNLPQWHLQMYIMYGATVVFFLPFCALCCAYTLILCTIWNKERTVHGSGGEPTPGCTRVRLNATNSVLPRAKMKIMKMTLVIILLFIVCGLPYFVVEMKVAFGDVTELDEEVTAVLGVFVVSNSAVNPFVYLFFSSKNRYLKRLGQAVCFCSTKEQRVNSESLQVSQTPQLRKAEGKDCEEEITLDINTTVVSPMVRESAMKLYTE
ncbi:probable G-protein coupled receptor 150 [Heptranchias perlo]|uniref:probable G-protein coupled receptor 150 n=1 Tax=Heptranchias perlo TaxID=212740 RepID=UPI00355A3107